MKALDCLVRAGMAPWQPQSDVSDLIIRHYHDTPLLGTFRRGDCSYGFMSLLGPGQRSFWAYFGLSEDEAADLATREFEDVDDARNAFERRFDGRPAVFATAADSRLLHWTLVDVTGDLFDDSITALKLMRDVYRSEEHDGHGSMTDEFAELLSL